MNWKRPVFTNGLAWVILIFNCLWATPAGAASSFKVLHSFGAGKDGNTPFAGVTFDSQGNLLGTASAGGGLGGCGGYGCGIVYQLTPNQDGTWTENVLHRFIQSEGGNPYSIIAIDSRGNLYGTNLYYGSGCGTVFQLVPGAGGTWTDYTLHPFTCGNDGFSSYGVVFDKIGRLYGTAYAGGIYNDGVVFSLSPENVFNWFEIVLHAFAGGNDGTSPAGNLIFDNNGSILGTTYEGGAHLTGTVFKLSRGGGANWTENILYTFKGQAFGGGTDGANPVAGVVMDATGNLYGTTDYGGPAAVGTVFKLAPNGDGTYTESALYTFKDGQDGGHPYGGVILDGNGNLYGTTQGHNNSFGTVYKLTPSSSGPWTETILYQFQGGSDGAVPYGGLAMDDSGNLYGTTAFGGQDGGGVVFEVTP